MGDAITVQQFEAWVLLDTITVPYTRELPVCKEENPCLPVLLFCLLIVA